VVGYAPPAIPVDLDGDGDTDFNVTVDPLVCKGSSAPPGFSAPMPLESNLWEVTVRATDANTGATTVVRQGVRMNQLSNYCT
ncbi:MAG TPA: hypothetical protein VLE20_13240, partial [Blastocatellia bacterium]|nr:hypothetical protein [Blastocatellia bacterium]